MSRVKRSGGTKRMLAPDAPRADTIIAVPILSGTAAATSGTFLTAAASSSSRRDVISGVRGTCR